MKNYTTSCPIIKLAKQLIRCHSISPNDAGCQTIIINRLEKIGFEVESINIDNVKNFCAWHGNGKTLAFAGHTDVVPPGNINYWVHPPFDPIVQNGMLIGRGAADMKGSLASMIIAAERFINSNPYHRGRLAFFITSDEEANAMHGTASIVETLMARNEKIDYCILGEPTSNVQIGDVIKNGRRGSITANLTIYGVQGHVAYPHLANNPIHIALPALNELIMTKWDHGNAFFPPTSMQILNIQAGNGSDNIIPGEINIQFNFRFNNNVTDEKIRQHIESLLDRHQLLYSVVWHLSGKPFLTSHGLLVDTVLNTIENYTKYKPKLNTTGGTSDGRFIAKMGTQIVELGPVNKTIHKINECVKVADLQLLSCIYQRIMEQLLM